MFKKEFGLRYVVDKKLSTAATVASTGKKLFYYSQDHKAARWGYRPSYSTLETLQMETEAILQTPSRQSL
jgi:hypothetical protein